jgi:hypothetical protein
VLSHPPYSPDFVPADFISYIKNCDERDEIQQTVTREVKAIRQEAFTRAFDSLYEGRKRCEDAGGDYIE